MQFVLESAALAFGQTADEARTAGASEALLPYKVFPGNQPSTTLVLPQLTPYTLGQLLAAIVTPANEQERAQVAELAAKVQEATGDTVEVAFVDQGYTGEQAAAAAEEHGIRLEVVKLPTTMPM